MHAFHFSPSVHAAGVQEVSHRAPCLDGKHVTCRAVKGCIQTQQGSPTVARESVGHAAARRLTNGEESWPERGASAARTARSMPVPRGMMTRCETSRAVRESILLIARSKPSCLQARMYRSRPCSGLHAHAVDVVLAGRWP